MKRWWHMWRLHVWKRQLAFRLLDLEAQLEHPTGGKQYVDTDRGIEAHTTDIENLVTRARQQIMIHTARISPRALEGIAEYPKARALKSGKESQDES